MNWHIESINETSRRVQTDVKSGLTSEEADRRLRSFGGNIIAEHVHKTFGQRVGYQLRAFLVVILLAAACISLVVAVNTTGMSWREPVIIAALTVVSAMTCAYIEQTAEDWRVRLISIAEPECRVIRDGRQQTIACALLVPGDIMLLEQGDIGPADGRLTECTGMCCDERLVGGDERSIEKDALAEPDITATVAGRSNLVYAGCAVLSGSGRAIVTETGSDTESGKQSTLLESADERDTPLKRQIGTMGKNVALAGLLVTLVVFIVGFSCRHSNNIRAIEVFLAAAAMAVTIIPECAPSVVAAIKQKCAVHMSEAGAVTKNADIVEKLGCVSVICADKSSIVEKTRMSVNMLWTPRGKLCSTQRRAPDEHALRLLEYAALCSDSGKNRTQMSTPGDNAIISCLLGCGVKKRHLDNRYPRVAVYPFDHEERIMLTIHSVGDSYVAMVKGSPERILPMCADYADGSDTLDKARAICERMGEDSLQVLAVACIGLEKLPEDQSWFRSEHGFAFIGLIGLGNHPAQETKITARRCERSGIRIVMITGDQAATAKAVATEAGILRSGEAILTAAELSRMNDEELENSLRQYSVFASMSVEDKQRIVRAWQQSGETVAVTGASVEDVPALRQADIGCSMGFRGAEAAKGTADITVIDDSLATVYNAVIDGRRAYNNIRSGVQYLLTCSLGIAAAVVISVLFSGVTPLLPAHFLLLFPFAVLLPSAAFGSEPCHPDLERTQPRRAEGRFFSTRFILDTVIYGSFIAALGAAAYFLGRTSDMQTARTMTYAVLALGLPVHALSVRTTASVFSIRFWKNADMLLTVFISAALILLTLFIPWEGFSLYELSAGQWTITVCLAVAPLIGGELLKLLRRMLGGHIITGIED